MAAACNESECTVMQTGVCLRNNDANTCPNRSEVSAAQAYESTNPPLHEPIAHARFPSSLALNPEEVRRLASGRYCYVVGILGLPASGKTAALVSTYLLLGKAKLKGFSFRDSKSLRALDEISHGARVWKEGQPVEQMTVHTELTDERTPGFMHLRLRRESDERVFDFLLPDLPGEWSSSLIDNDRVDRLGFLHAADVIWLMVDGEELKSKRHYTVHRTQLLLARLAAFLSRRPAVSFVVTRRDYGAPDQGAIDELKSEATRLGFPNEVVAIASFKTGGHSNAGAGLSELIAGICEKSPLATDFWPSQIPVSDRAMLKFRNVHQ